MPNPRHALVTGASAGIGRELVRQLVQNRGYTVLATARRRERLEALAAELPPGAVMTLAGDLADEAFRAQLWERAEGLPGGLELLINNAAFGHYEEFSAEDPETTRRMVEVNLVALFDLTQRAIRHMKTRGDGEIVEVSSALGFLGLPYSATYVATKHAINGLVKSLRYELRGSGVRIWAACPIRTESEFHAVALRRCARPVRSGFAEPTARVARGILRGLGCNRTFVFPTMLASSTVRAARWLPGPYEWFMNRWAPAHFQREMEAGRSPE